MNEKLIEKMIIKSFQQYQCSPISKEDRNASETYSNGDSFKY